MHWFTRRRGANAWHRSLFHACAESENLFNLGNRDPVLQETLKKQQQKKVLRRRGLILISGSWNPA